jgi:hypothetical protein
VKKTYRSSFLLFVFGLIMSASVTAEPLTEQQKIEALIHSVEVLPGAHFIRNGSSYEGKAAADHLRTKRNYAGDRIKTAIDFITCCASKSSMSGQPYRIQYANGTTVDAEVYFLAELKRIETPLAPAPIPVAVAVPVAVPVVVPVAGRVLPPVVGATTVAAAALVATPTHRHQSVTSSRRSHHHHVKTSSQKRPS